MRDGLKYVFFLFALGFFIFQAARADVLVAKTDPFQEMAKNRCANDCR